MLGETDVGDFWGLHEHNKGGPAEPGTPGCLLGHPAMLTREHDDLLQRVVSETSASNLSLRGSGGDRATHGQCSVPVYCAVVTTLNPDRSCGQQPPSALSARAELR